MNDVTIILICFCIGFISSWVVTGKKGKEGKYFPNLVIVANTNMTKCSSDDDMCYHIHHWIFLGIMLAFYVALNYLLGYKASIKYLYLIAIYFGSFLSEYMFYGNDIFKVYQKCYPNCV